MRYGLLFGVVVLSACARASAPSPAPAAPPAGETEAQPPPAEPVTLERSAPPAPPCREPMREPLPDGAVARLGSSAIEHGAFIRVAFHPDGERLVSGGFYGDVHLWDARTARVTAMIGRPDDEDEDLGGMNALAVTHDGRFAIVAGYRALLFYDLGRRQLHEAVPVAGEHLWDAAVARDAPVGVYGRCVRGGDSVGTFDTRRGTLLDTFATHRAESGETCSHEVAISPDGELIAADADREVVLIRRESGEEIARVRVGGVAVQSLAFTEDGKHLVVATTDEALNVLDTETLRAVRSFGWVPESTSASWLQSASVSPDGERLAAEAHGIVRIWDYETQAVTAMYGGVEGHDAGPVWSPDGTLLAYPSSRPDTLVVMDVARGTRLGVSDLCRHDREVTQLVFSDDARLVATAAADGTVRVWETTSGRPLARLERADRAAFTADGARVLVSGAGCAMRVHRAADGELIAGEPAKDEPHTGAHCFARGIVRSPTSDVVAVTDSRGTLRLVSASDANEIATIEIDPGGGLSAPAWSSDGARIAVAHGEGIAVVNASARRVARTIPVAGAKRVQYSPDGQLLAASLYDELQLLGPDGKPRHRFAHSWFSGVTFVSNTRLLLARDGGVITDLDGALVERLDDRASVRVVAKSRDGKRVATSDGTGVSLVWRRP